MAGEFEGTVNIDSVRYTDASGIIPPENGMLSEIVGEQGWNTSAASLTSTSSGKPTSC